MRQEEATDAARGKGRVVIMGGAMVRVRSRERSGVAVVAIRLSKPKRGVVAIQVSQHIRNANRLLKASQHLDQVNPPMVQVAASAVAEIALLAIVLAQIGAVIDKYFYSAHCFWVSVVRNPNLEKINYCLNFN